jgi:hypothetical protein
LQNALKAAKTQRERDGIRYADKRMQREGWDMVDANLQYRGNQGVDLVYRRRNAQGRWEYAIVEAKAGKGLSDLTTYNPANKANKAKAQHPDRAHLEQGTMEYNMSRLRRYEKYGKANPTYQQNMALVQDIRNAAAEGRMRSFASFAQGQRLYEIPRGYGRVLGVQATLIP